MNAANLHSLGSNDYGGRMGNIFHPQLPPVRRQLMMGKFLHPQLPPVRRQLMMNAANLHSMGSNDYGGRMARVSHPQLPPVRRQLMMENIFHHQLPHVRRQLMMGNIIILSCLMYGGN